jgi:hypothetical protein
VRHRKDSWVDPADEPSTKPGPSWLSTRVLVIAGVALGVLLVGVVTLSGYPGQGPVIGAMITDASSVPEVGQVWFGNAFDPRTFHISDRTTTVKTGATVAAVAHLTISIGDGEAYWRSLRNEQLFQNGLLRFSGTGDVLGTTISPIHQEGRYEYEIVDLGGNVLARGEFVVANQ